jgi:LuxR family transcriptional regulator of spore coat protein
MSMTAHTHTRASGAPLTGTELTERERVVLARLHEDRTLRQIAAELYVTRNTIKSQVRSVYRKLGVTSRAAAVERAHEQGLGVPTPRVAGGRESQAWVTMQGPPTPRRRP